MDVDVNELRQLLNMKNTTEVDKDASKEYLN